MKHLLVNKKLIKYIPESPGVYIFFKDQTPIYIGKAKNLKARIGSYFLHKLGTKTKRMKDVSTSLTFTKVTSELESLLLEAHLIRIYKPWYNSSSKDDKHALYIEITKEKYPRVITARKKEDNVFGPFPSSPNVYSVLRMLRRIFPYSDHKVGKRPCLYSHIGLCYPCPSEVERIKDEKLKKILRKKYFNNIRMIKGILSRRILLIKRRLVKDMERLSKEERFEEANVVKEQIYRLDYITQPIIPIEHFLENPNFESDVREKELASLSVILSPYIPGLKSLKRIECFDVSHLGGLSPTASMVTFIDGSPEKAFYRHFRIRQIKSLSDFDSMAEVAKRRSKYLSTWGTPNLIVVDGGRSQVSAFLKTFRPLGVPIVGIAKSEEKLVIESNNFKLQGPALHLIQRLRDEAHRFARRYHHKLIRKSYFLT